MQLIRRSRGADADVSGVEVDIGSRGGPLAAATATRCDWLTVEKQPAATGRTDIHIVSREVDIAIILPAPSGACGQEECAAGPDATTATGADGDSCAAILASRRTGNDAD